MMQNVTRESDDATNGSLALKRAVMWQMVEERRAILEEQSRAMAEHYKRCDKAPRLSSYGIRLLAVNGMLWEKERTMPKYDRLIMWVIILLVTLTMLTLSGRTIVDLLP